MEAQEHVDFMRTLSAAGPGWGDAFERVLAASCPMAFLSLDLDGRVTTWDAAAEAMLGRSAAAAIGERLPVPDPVSGDPLADLERRLAAGEVVEGEPFMLLKGDGSRVDVKLSAAPILDVTGGASGAVIGLQDVTDRRRARDRLALLDTALESAASAMVITDRDGVIQWVNRAFTEVTGYTTDEAVGRTPGDLIGSGEHDRAFYEQFWDTLLRGEVWRGRVVNRRKDGTLYPEEQVVTPVHDDTGRITHFIAVKEDVADWEEAWRRIRFQATLLAAVGQAVIATDLEGRVIYWNRAAQDLYGWKVAEALGRDVIELTAAEPALGEARDILRRLRNGEHWSGEFRLRRKDGSTFVGLVADSPIMDEDEEMVGIIGVSSDLTKRREMEAALRQSQKMEAVGRLAGGVAHDFNNLLTVIQSRAEMLIEDLPEASEFRGEVAEILGEAERAKRLTRQLLAFSRHQVLENKVFDVGAMVAGMEPLLRRLVPSRIRVELEIAPVGLSIQADPSQVEQVLLNLAVNAADAIETHGTIRFQVREVIVEPGEFVNALLPVEPGRYVGLSVEDTGHGISAEVKERMFEPFFTTKPAERGTGLGLSTVFGIVEQSGGGVRVESEPGSGSRFEILFPRVTAAAPLATPRPSTADPESERDEGPDATRRTTLLIVDDTAAVLRVTERLLERAGYVVVTATNGREALEAMEEHGGEIALVLSDIVMPDVGGAALLDHVLAKWPGVRVVLTSGHADDEIALEAVRRATAFLPKPYRAADLVRTVREVLAVEV